MIAGHADVPFRGVHAGHNRPEAAKRFTNQSTAAADVEDFEAGQWFRRQRITPVMRRQTVANELQPDGVEFMQRPKTTAGIPPLVGKRRESGDFVGIYGAF